MVVGMRLTPVSQKAPRHCKLNETSVRNPNASGRSRSCAAAKISTRGRTAPGVHRFRSRSASRAGRVHSQAGCGHIAARSEEMTKLHEQRRERTRSTFREFDE